MIALHNLDTTQQYITAEGMQELQQRLTALKQERMKMAAEIRDLTSQSSTNSALEDSARTLNQNQAAEIDNQISLIERTIGTAKMIGKPVSNEQIQIGSQVTLDIAGKKRTYTIVGSIEADPDEGKVSNKSPLGQSLLGKKVNDYFEVALTRQRFGARVVAIE